MRRDYRSVSGGDISYYVFSQPRGGGERDTILFNTAEAALQLFGRLPEQGKNGIGCCKMGWYHDEIDVVQRANGEPVMASEYQYWRYRREVPEDVVAAVEKLARSLNVHYALENDLVPHQPVLVPYGTQTNVSEKLQECELAPDGLEDVLSSIRRIDVREKGWMNPEAFQHFVAALGEGRYPIVRAVDASCIDVVHGTLGHATFTPDEFRAMEKQFSEHHQKWLDFSSWDLAERIQFIAGDARPGLRTYDVDKAMEYLEAIRYDLLEEGGSSYKVLFEKIADGRIGQPGCEGRATKLIADIDTFDSRQTVLSDMVQDAKYAAWLKNQARNPDHGHRGDHGPLAR